MRTINSLIALTLTAALTLALGASVGAQATTTSTANLGTVRIAQSVTANGQPLPSGSYQVRLTTEAPSKVVGQTVAETRWVEFVRGTTVAGREVATLISATDMRTMAKMPRKGGAVRIETLKGGDYLRLWITHSGENILIHLPITK
jgi:hypothetical protein